MAGKVRRKGVQCDEEELLFVSGVMGALTIFLKGAYPHLNDSATAGPEILADVAKQFAAYVRVDPALHYTSREAYLWCVGYVRGLLGPV